MEIIETEIVGLKILENTVFTDERGYFTETFRENWLPDVSFLQENESFSKKNVLRGLHYQTEPYAQAKLVRCVMGEILDVAVDLRENSPTLGQYFKVKLSGENKKQFFIPRGFAHGFLTLSDWALVAYKVDNYYHKESEVTLQYNDKRLSIDWGVDEEKVLLSRKDKEALCFSEVKLFNQ